MEQLKRFILQNPLLAAGVFCVLMIGIYYAGSTIWSAAHVAILERKNAQLEQEGKRLEDDLKGMTDNYQQTRGQLTQKEQELKDKDAILESLTKQVVENKKLLDKASVDYNAARDNDAPMSSSELHDTLCRLYPEKCN